MAVIKKNTYVPGTNNDLTNVALNIDLQRLGLDLTQAVVSGANILVKAGSLVECNGSLYALEGSDVTLAAAVGVLVFDSATLTFSVSAAAYAYDPAKAGEYITGSPTKRVCRWQYQTSPGSQLFIRAPQTDFPWYMQPRLAASFAGTQTSGAWFTLFAPFVPLTGDAVACSGGVSTLLSVSKMTRTDAATITVSGWNGSAVTSITFVSGSGTSVGGAVSI